MERVGDRSAGPARKLEVPSVGPVPPPRLPCPGDSWEGFKDMLAIEVSSPGGPRLRVSGLRAGELLRGRRGVRGRGCGREEVARGGPSRGSV